jgi:hypothetical protein
VGGGVVTRDYAYLAAEVCVVVIVAGFIAATVWAVLG